VLGGEVRKDEKEKKTQEKLGRSSEALAEKYSTIIIISISVIINRYIDYYFRFIYKIGWSPCSGHLKTDPS